MVRLVKVFDAKKWEESSKVGGGPQLMRKILSNKLQNLESCIDLLNVEIQDFRVMLEGLDKIFGAHESSQNRQSGVPNVVDFDTEDTSSLTEAD